jgi:DNA-binding protein H-NS
MDLSTMSISQLRDLQQQIPVEIKRREAEEKVNALNELRAFAKSRGYAIEDLLAVREAKTKAAGGKVKVKYRHPDNADLEWTGRGRKPKWVEAWLADGKTMESLLV